MAYNVGATNATSSVYPNDPENIRPIWQSKHIYCNLINNIYIYTK